MRPFFSYFGSKWALARGWLPSPAYQTIIEPFAGSAGYSTVHCDPRVNVILNDLDPIICEVWRYLVRVSPAELLALPDFEDGQTVDDLAVCPEARLLIGFWIARCTASPRKTPSAWMRSGKYPRSFWGPRVRETLARQVTRIRHWTVTNKDYRDIEFNGYATWLIDPPYQTTGAHYRISSIDYSALRLWMSSRRGQVILCENDGANWEKLSRFTSVRTTKKGKYAVEGYHCLMNGYQEEQNEPPTF